MENSKVRFDLSSHVVNMNNLMGELNRLTRDTHKPEWYRIDEVVTDIRHYCSMIQRMVDEARL